MEPIIASTLQAIGACDNQKNRITFLLVGVLTHQEESHNRRDPAGFSTPTPSGSTPRPRTTKTATAIPREQPEPVQWEHGRRSPAVSLIPQKAMTCQRIIDVSFTAPRDFAEIS
jgi:hypothetical protein